MTRSRTLILLLASLLVFSTPVSCAPPPKTENIADLAVTLAVKLAEQTAQAAVAEEAAAVEEAPPLDEAPPQGDFTLPGEPPGEPERTLVDSNCGFSGWAKKATQGDNFLNGLYERPFTAQDMVYQPDLDITSVDFMQGDGYFFFTIRLYGMNNQGGGLLGLYAIELDETLDGRGDLLVTARNPGGEWSTDGVTIYDDQNRDVGGSQPLVADVGFYGSGYDTVFPMEAGRTAFARLDPLDGNAVQFAVSSGLLVNPDAFAWGAWADNGLMDPSLFDYNDTMGPTEAGSPILGEEYPVKGLYNLDNTCRLLVGAGPSGTVPGLCKVGAPPGSKGNGCTWRCTKDKFGSSEDFCKMNGGDWVCD